jgi:hypothetical protein
MRGRFCLDITLKCHPEAVFFLPKELIRRRSQLVRQY